MISTKRPHTPVVAAAAVLSMLNAMFASVYANKVQSQLQASGKNGR